MNFLFTNATPTSPTTWYDHRMMWSSCDFVINTTMVFIPLLSPSLGDRRIMYCFSIIHVIKVLDIVLWLTASLTRIFGNVIIDQAESVRVGSFLCKALGYLLRHVSVGSIRIRQHIANHHKNLCLIEILKGCQRRGQGLSNFKAFIVLERNCPMSFEHNKVVHDYVQTESSLWVPAYPILLKLCILRFYSSYNNTFCHDGPDNRYVFSTLTNFCLVLKE